MCTPNSPAGGYSPSFAPSATSIGGSYAPSLVGSGPSFAAAVPSVGAGAASGGFSGASALAGAGLGLSAFSAVSNVLGAYAQSRATKGAYNYQAQIAANNAQYADWQAQDALARGRTAEQYSRLRTAQIKGQQVAGFAANNVDAGEGSALNILTDTDYFGARDALAVRDTAARESWAYGREATNYRNNAALLRAQARAISPRRAALGSLLTGAGQVAAGWYSFGQAGAL